LSSSFDESFLSSSTTEWDCQCSRIRLVFATGLIILASMLLSAILVTALAFSITKASLALLHPLRLNTLTLPTLPKVL